MVTTNPIFTSLESFINYLTIKLFPFLLISICCKVPKSINFPSNHFLIVFSLASLMLIFLLLKKATTKASLYPCCLNLF